MYSGFQMLHRTETVLLKVCTDLLLVADRPELALHCGVLVFTLDSCVSNKGAALEQQFCGSSSDILFLLLVSHSSSVQAATVYSYNVPSFLLKPHRGKLILTNTHCFHMFSSVLRQQTLLLSFILFYVYSFVKIPVQGPPPPLREDESKLFLILHLL